MVSTPRPLSLVPGGLLSASGAVPRVPESADRALATSSPSALLWAAPDSELWLASPCLCLLRSVNILLRMVRSAEPLLRKVNNKQSRIRRLPGATAGICSPCRQCVGGQITGALLCKGKGQRERPTLRRATAERGAVQVLHLAEAQVLVNHRSTCPSPLVYVGKL